MGDDKVKVHREDEVECKGNNEMDGEGDYEVQIESLGASEDDDKVDDTCGVSVGLVNVPINVASDVQNIVEGNVINEVNLMNKN